MITLFGNLNYSWSLSNHVYKIARGSVKYFKDQKPLNLFLYLMLLVVFFNTYLYSKNEK